MTTRKRKKHGGARPGAGRPPSGKERRFELKMPVTVYAAFAAAAARAGKPLGTWLIAQGEAALAAGAGVAVLDRLIDRLTNKESAR